MNKLSLTASINILVSFSAFTTFIGYSFLTDYYAMFGVRLQSLDSNVQHYLVRGIDLARYDFWLFSILIVLLIFSLLFDMRFSFQFLGVKIAKTIIILPVTIILFVSAEIRTDSLATKISLRDTFPATTGLRQLTCLKTSNESIDQWVLKKLIAGRKMLVLYQSSDKLLVFLEPRFKVGEPRVDIFTFSLQSGYAIRDTVASATGSNVGSHTCLG